MHVHTQLLQLAQGELSQPWILRLFWGRAELLWGVVGRTKPVSKTCCFTARHRSAAPRPCWVQIHDLV